MRTASLFLFACFLVTAVCSQQTLLVEKVGGLKRVRYIEGQKVAFTVLHTEENGMQSEEDVEGTLSEIASDSIAINGMPYAIADIYKWHKPFEKRRLPDFLQGAFSTAGVAYFAVSSFNGLVNNDAPIIHPSASIALVVGVGLGTFFKYVPRRYYPIYKEKWQVRSVDFSATEPEAKK